MKLPPLQKRVLSTGQPSTLGSYRDNCAAFFGAQSKATQYFDEKIAGDPQGRDAEVIVDEHQMIALIRSLLRS